MHFRTCPLQMAKKQPAFRRASGDLIKSVFFFDRFQGAHQMDATNPETKSAPSAQTNASQKRCSTAAMGASCGLRREGIAADAEDQLLRDCPLRLGLPHTH